MRRIGLALIVALTSACSSGDNVATATAAADGFHRQFNAGDYDAIYANADRLRKKSGSAMVSATWFKTIRNRLGDFRSAEAPGWSEQITVNGHFVTLIYHSRYAKGAADETFVFRVDGASARLVDYNISLSAN